MISAWDVYWVMQLDRINNFFLFATVMALFAPLAAGMISDGELVWNGKAERLFPWAKWALILAPFLLIAGVLTPSTKTAAAMILLPAVANNETIHREAGELYSLAKQALTDAVGKPDEAQP